MRYLVLILMLSACSTYPRIQWPADAKPAATPPLLPQAALVAEPGATDSGPALVARAAVLRDWAASVAR